MENCGFCGKQFKKGYTTQHQKARNCIIIKKETMEEYDREAREHFRLQSEYEEDQYILSMMNNDDDEQECHRRLF
jgi:hypothetical protein